MIADAVLFTGAFQLRLICEKEMVATVNPVGGGNTVCVVAEAVFDGELVPTEFIAETR